MHSRKVSQISTRPNGAGPVRTRCRVADKWPLGLLVVALLARAIYYFAYLRSPLFVFHQADRAFYREWAMRIADGDWLGAGVFEQGPLYAYQLGLTYAVLGPHDSLVVAGQLLLGVANCLLVYACGRRLFDQRTAVVAGLLAAVYGPLIYHECMVMKSFLSPLLTMLSLYACLRYAEAGRVRWVWLAGIAVGLACLIRENHILLLLPAAAWLWSQRSSLSLSASGSWLHLFVLPVACGGILLPSAVRNYVVSQEFVVVTAGGGEVFYMAHGPQAKTGYYFPPGFASPNVFLQHKNFRKEARRRTGRQLSRGESSRYWFGEGFREIAARPGRALRKTAATAAILFNDFEVPGNQNYTLTGESVPVLRILPSFGWMVGLGFVGMGIGLANWRRLFLPMGFVLAHVVSVVLTYNLSRFRLGMMPVWTLFAAHGLIWLVGTWRQADTASRVRATFGTVVVILITIAAFRSPVGRSREAIDVEIDRMRRQLNSVKDVVTRISFLEEDLASNPNEATIHNALGVLTMELGQISEGTDHYLQAFRIKPDYAKAHFNFAVDLERIGRLEETIAHLQQSIEIEPDFAAAHSKLGLIHTKEGRLTEALDHFKTVVQIEPDSADAHSNLGVAYARIGNSSDRKSHSEAMLSEAVSQFREALRIDPNHGQSQRNLDSLLREIGEKPIDDGPTETPHQ